MKQLSEEGGEESLAQLSTIGEGDSLPNVADFVEDFEYNKSGVVTKMTYANDTTQTWEFDNRKRISRITIKHLTDAIEDLHYTINGSGDILTINENEYTYDGFNRIVGVKTLVPGNTDKIKLVARYFGTYQTGDPIDGISYDVSADLNADGRVNGDDHILAVAQTGVETYDVEDFTYDKNGNRLVLTQNGDEYRYSYGARNRLIKIERKKKDAAVYSLYVQYEYDANGNTTKRTISKDDGPEEITFTYDTMNRLITTTKGSEVTIYTYDNAGNRLIKQSPNSATLYLRHGQIAVAMDVEINTDQTEVKWKVNRYVLSGDLVAGRVTTTKLADDSVITAKSWYHLDHLNSTKVVTGVNGVVEVSYTYRAFGEQLKRLDANGSDTDDSAKYSYGGKELDDDTNLYYFNARYYDATIGRFINVDPVQDGSNWYVYCGNNPMVMVDPTGLYEIEFQDGQDWGDDEKAVVENAYEETKEYVNNSIEFLQNNIQEMKENNKEGNLDEAINNSTKALSSYQKLQKGLQSEDKLRFSKKHFEFIRDTDFAAITFLTLINCENVIEVNINKKNDFFKNSSKQQTDTISHELFHVADVHHNAEGSDPWYKNPYYLSTNGAWLAEAIKERIVGESK